MRVRHVVAQDNVTENGSIVDAQAVRHALIYGRQITALAGLIDPLTHLNLDFAEHRLETCVVVTALAVGGEAMFEEDGFMLAVPEPQAFSHLGHVDIDARRIAWHAAFQAPR